ncbi:MAG: hypothetical protein ACHQF0_02255 [Chitinophagales bacterium]
MKIDYTIENEKIKIQNFDRINNQNEFVKLYDNSLPDISFLHIKGNIRNKTKSVFYAVNGKGIILSIQLIPQNSRFEFESFNNISVNFTPVVESVQLMMTDIPFRHYYDNPALLNRLDIYIAAEKIGDLIPKKLLMQLGEHRILNLSSTAENRKFSSISDSLNKLIKELEKPNNRSLSTYFEKFVQSVTL